MARPVGAENKDKPFREALRMELAAMGDNHKALRKIARAVISAASDGKMDAVREIGDRLDGKPVQGTVISGDPDNPLEVNQTNFTPEERARLVIAMLNKSKDK
jgi:hypothetical protein